MKNKLIIDASNLRDGGGVTHIVEILNSITDNAMPFDEVEIFSNNKTLSQVVDRHWLTKHTHNYLNKGLLHISLWRLLYFKKYLNTQQNAILFNPSGTYVGSFSPFVSMSHNMLIWDKTEMQRFKTFSFYRLKFYILNILQKKSFNKSSGIIFISNYAKNVITKQLNTKAKTILIPHGINKRFVNEPKKNTSTETFQLTYISNLIAYKHQILLIKAAKRLRNEGYDFSINLIGGYDSDYKKEFDKEFNSDDTYKEFINYLGKVSFSDIHSYYKNTQGFIFASSCENMPNILIEAMSAGLPILCSNYQPMPEFLGEDHEFYFNPTDQESIYLNLKQFLNSSQLYESAKKSYEKALKYNWEDCANQTFNFLFKTLKST